MKRSHPELVVDGISWTIQRAIGHPAAQSDAVRWLLDRLASFLCACGKISPRRMSVARRPEERKLAVGADSRNEASLPVGAVADQGVTGAPASGLIERDRAIRNRRSRPGVDDPGDVLLSF